MLQTLLEFIFGEAPSSPNRQADITSDVSKESVIEKKSDNILDDEVLKLARLYGPLASGKRIELSLQEALREFPRERKRSDAYKSLINKVKQDYGTDLIISGRKEKK